MSLHSSIAKRCLRPGIVLVAGLMMASAIPSAVAADGPSGPSSAPPKVHGAEPFSVMAGSRPVSGQSPSAGPKFTKSGDTWRVVAPEVVLRNTVTDADGEKSTLTFEVYTANADGTPGTKVNLTDANPYGVLVSPYVTSGSTASVKVDYGRLKPRTTYLMHTNAYDGSLYETTWSPWAKFRIEPYVTFPTAQSTSGIDSTAQTTVEFTRTDPDGSATATSSTATAQSSPTLADFDKDDCSKQDKADRMVCFRMVKRDKAKSVQAPPKPGKTRETKQTFTAKSAESAGIMSTPGGNDAVDLVDWCTNAAEGLDYMNRTEACLKTLGEGELWFFDADPKKPAIGRGTFLFEQRMKTYRNKTESGSDFAEFDQQLVIAPTYIDPALEGVTMRWDIDSSCSACDVAPIQWTDDGANPVDGASWDYDSAQDYRSMWGTVVTRWLGTGKEQIDLDWSITATVDASDSVDATADFGSSGVASMRELAPRCDDITRGAVTPGCVLPFFKPTFTVDTNLYPAAGAYYWLMQERMPDHAGSKKWDSLAHYLGPETAKRNASGAVWSSDDSRKVVCPTTWTKHPADSIVGTTDCDEYAPASTHESGGYPGGLNQVTSGNQCAQLYTDWVFNGVGDGSTSFGLLADTRVATNGPTGTERCGRAAIDSSQNQGAFHKLQPSLWRLTDGDGFFIDTPGFNHCSGVAVTCTWRKV
ncbi:hypothetical protein [Streptomyces sp. NPDC051219]|uniref:hypothetical protein n=1 Tax=Streptomyces sp. NPDC051219 TaxID=3155283 RepID=UPI00342B5F5C